MGIGLGDVSVAEAEGGKMIGEVLNTSPESLDCMACLNIYLCLCRIS